MEKKGWTDRVTDKKVLRKVKAERKKERNTAHIIKGRKSTSIGHVLCRNCLLTHVIG